MSTVSFSHPQSSLQGPAALSGPGGVIACMICLAAYVPSRGYQQLTTAPNVVIESAFMSMCRFCFRCRRPACPSCWDEVNGICGACVAETHLLFRAEPPALTGVMIPPAQATQQKIQAISTVRGMPPFVCVQPGRFHKSDSAPIATAPSMSAHDEQESYEGYEEYGEQESTPASRFVRLLLVVERVLTYVMFIILIGIALLIVAALVSLPANTIIANSLNIDIRAEIAYLLQLIHQLHS